MISKGPSDALADARKSNQCKQARTHTSSGSASDSPNAKLRMWDTVSSSDSVPAPGALYAGGTSVRGTVVGEGTVAEAGEGGRSSWSSSSSESELGVAARRGSKGARPRTSRWDASTRQQSRSASTRRSAVSEPDDLRGPREPARVEREVEEDEHAGCAYGEERPLGDESVRRREGMLSWRSWEKLNQMKCRLVVGEGRCSWGAVRRGGRGGGREERRAGQSALQEAMWTRVVVGGEREGVIFVEFYRRVGFGSEGVTSVHQKQLLGEQQLTPAQQTLTLPTPAFPWQCLTTSTVNAHRRRR